MRSLEINKDNMEVSQLSAALHAKCPRCRKGDMFKNSMYGFKAQEMHKNCPNCNLQFEKEPGYFYVAMFVSYAMNVAQIVALGILTYLFTGNSENPWVYIIVIFLGIVILSPFNYRYSRVILLYWLTPGLHYDPTRGKLK